ncbi:4'-phosphopantetheinyl transferase, partial [Bifidobacterium longum]
LDEIEVCIASMFVGRVRQCFSAVWADGFPRCRHRFPVM